MDTTNTGGAGSTTTEGTSSSGGESRMQQLSQATQESAASLIQDWRVALTKMVDETEKFTKDKPFVAIGAAFTAGVVFNEIMSALFRRRR
ncbi:MAG: hypothetical protein AB2A00_11330 [Myxococcota bacterium]